MQNYFAIPTNKTNCRFDTLIVLGQPPKPDGTLAPELRERVLEGVREYKAGVAGHVIMTGGAAIHPGRGACMKVFSRWRRACRGGDRRGRPGDGYDLEHYFSEKVMEVSGGRESAEVVRFSVAPHGQLDLAALQVFAWRTHASRWPVEFSMVDVAGHFLGEAKRVLDVDMQTGFKRNKWLQRRLEGKEGES